MFNLNNNGKLHLKAGIKSLILPKKQIKGTGGTNNARYCYTVWMRHLLNLIYNYNIKECPKHILEIGPGESLGVGFAAIFCGASSYTSIDSIDHKNRELNIRLLDDIYYLIKSRSEIPNDDEFPSVFPKLEDNSSPAYIFDILSQNLDIDKIYNILKKDLKENTHKHIISISEYDFNKLKFNKKFDFILSQAVLEHIEYIEQFYGYMAGWLTENGYISHTIDYRSHQQTDKWNGHWIVNKYIWKILLLGYGYCINRKPHSFHIEQIQKYFFELKIKIQTNNEGLEFEKYNNKLRLYTKEDFNISTSFIQGKKK